MEVMPKANRQISVVAIRGGRTLRFQGCAAAMGRYTLVDLGLLR